MKGKEIKNASKGIEVEIGSEKETLKYDLNAFAELEEEYGDIEEALNVLETGSIKGIRLILWAGLIHKYCDEKGNPTITPREVGAKIDLATDMENITNALGDALGDALPQEEGQNKNVPLEKRPSPKK